jgi:microcystin degradation protein MlrC
VARGIANVAFGPIWDPMSVAICAAAGEGEELMLRIGAKSGPEAGRPVDLRCRVRRVIRDFAQPAMGPIPAVPFGDVVSVVAPNDVDIVLHSRRAGTLRPEVLTEPGIDLARKQIVVAKMWRHGQQGFRDVARDFKLLSTPGTQTLDFARIPFREFTRAYWPRVADPFAANGPP